MTESGTVQCPHCWELIDISIDPSVPSQCYTEDCAVCCRPIVLSVLIGDVGAIDVTAAREDDV